MIGRDLKGYGMDYPVISWPGDALVAVSLVVEFEEGAERSPLYGDDGPEVSPQPVRPQGSGRAWTIESTFEYGSRRGIWRLMDIFDKHDIKATFFCSGAALEANPQAARSITQRGHEAAGHGYRWLPSYELSRDEEKADMERAVEAIQETSGQRPVGWHSRAPSVHTPGAAGGERGLPLRLGLLQRRPALLRPGGGPEIPHDSPQPRHQRREVPAGAPGPGVHQAGPVLHDAEGDLRPPVRGGVQEPEDDDRRLAPAPLGKAAKGRSGGPVHPLRQGVPAGLVPSPGGHRPLVDGALRRPLGPPGTIHDSKRCSGAWIDSSLRSE